VIAGVDGPCVLLSAETAAWLEHYAKLTSLRVRVRGVPGRQRVSRELEELRAVATQYRPAPLPEVEVDIAEVGPRLEQWLSPAQVADRLWITDRAVRLACQQGRMAGELVGNRWRITEAAVESFKTERAGARG
jgi:excisionase family DNA binding protein